MSVDVFFNKKKDLFYEELKANVNKYFEENKISKKGNLQMYLITIFILAWTYGCYFLILFGGFSEPVMLALAAGMGIGVAGCGMAFMHDGSHNAYSENPKVNYFIGSLLNLLGSHKYIWDIRHNVLHHRFTNVYKYDYDMVKIWLVRHSPEAKKRWFHKFQHIYAPLMIYPWYTMFWLLFYDIFHLNMFSGNFGRDEENKHPMATLVSIIFWRIFYFFYILVIPFLVLGLPFWKILIGFLVLHVATSLALCTIFQLAHVMMETTHEIPDKDGNLKNTWAESQVKSSCNFSLDNKLITLYCGGLNFQIEHHLFPGICSIHYPKLQPIIKATIEKHGLPYNVHSNIFQAMGSHLEFLKHMGAEEDFKKA